MSALRWTLEVLPNPLAVLGPAGPAFLGEGVAVPARFEVTFRNELGQRATLHVVVEDGRAGCETVTLDRADGRRLISYDHVRAVPVDRLVTEACLAASVLVRQNPEKPDESVIEPLREVDVDAVVGTIGRRQRSRSDPDRLRQVAEVYQAAETNPRQAVAEFFSVTPGTAGNLIWRARKDGYLPKTRPGVATNRKDDR